jgi:hypothetical protein
MVPMTLGQFWYAAGLLCRTQSFSTYQIGLRHHADMTALEFTPKKIDLAQYMRISADTSGRFVLRYVCLRDDLGVQLDFFVTHKASQRTKWDCATMPI